MKHTFWLLLIALLTNLTSFLQAQPSTNRVGTASSFQYVSLNPKDPILFEGTHVTYNGQRIKLGPYDLFLDGQLTDEFVAANPYVFNSLQSAVKALRPGSESKPMTLHLAPWVYWVDDPDDPAVREAPMGGTPYGLMIDCPWLFFHGLSKDPAHVVLAANRGQTMGAKGNFTLFRLLGDGIRSECVTFGNYCNVDLEFPLKPSLGRPKRGPAIVQAQLIHCNGDKLVARKTRFISRLNLCPFVGAKRILFDQCHFESTDDALCGTGLYHACTLDFHSSKPFYSTSGTGAVFLNCDIRVLTHGRQYFTKANGQVGLVDTRIQSAPDIYLGWRDQPPLVLRNYQFGVMQNDHPVSVGVEDPFATIDMSGKPLLDAYRFEHRGEVVYNTYNLLRGDDDWDPQGLKEKVLQAERDLGRPLTGLPVQLTVRPSNLRLETGKDQGRLTASLLRFGGGVTLIDSLTWRVAPDQAHLVRLIVEADGKTCTVLPTQQGDSTETVVVTVSDRTGLEAAAVVRVLPSMLEPPSFIRLPSLSAPKDGVVTLDYALDMTYTDQSLVTWYRCTDASGGGAVPVAVSRHQQPLLNYTLSAGDVGYYLMATVQPAHLRCKPGNPVSVCATAPVSAPSVKADRRRLKTTFSQAATFPQPAVLPGFWTMDVYKAAPSTTATGSSSWYYGEGMDGAAHREGLLQGRSGTLLYTPVGEVSGNMRFDLLVTPFKTAGQGFSVADLFMDVVLQFDNVSLTGYGLRLIRTIKHGNTVDAYLVRYDQGAVTALSQPITTTCFKPSCRIAVSIIDGVLTAKAWQEGAEAPQTLSVDTTTVPSSPYHSAVFLQAVVPVSRSLGGAGVLYNGGSSTMIDEVELGWD